MVCTLDAREAVDSPYRVKRNQHLRLGTVSSPLFDSMKSFEDDALYRGNTEWVTLKDARNISMVLVGNEIDILYQEVAIPNYARNYHVAYQNMGKTGHSLDGEFYTLAREI